MGRGTVLKYILANKSKGEASHTYLGDTWLLGVYILLVSSSGNKIGITLRYFKDRNSSSTAIAKQVGKGWRDSTLSCLAYLLKLN